MDVREVDPAEPLPPPSPPERRPEDVPGAAESEPEPAPAEPGTATVLDLYA